MKLSLICPVCSGLAYGTVGYDPGWMVDVEVRDDGAYLSHCPKGHPFVTYLRQNLFEMLFEISVNAIVDGYYREAVTSFAASLERFYEFSIKVFSAANALDEKTFNGLWKQIGNHSERQLGAYISMHAICIRKPPVLLQNVSFRNSVVHKGKIPTMDEALEFGEQVRSLLTDSIVDLKREFSDILRSYNFQPQVIPVGTAPGMVISEVDYPTVISLGDRPAEAPLLQIVEARRKQR